MRELDNLLQRALILVNGPVIEPEHIQFELLNEPLLRSTQLPLAGDRAAAAPHGSLARELARRGREDLILEALRSGNGRREVAERLGISPRTLRYKLARLREAGVEVPAA